MFTRRRRASITQLMFFFMYGSAPVFRKRGGGEGEEGGGGCALTLVLFSQGVNFSGYLVAYKHNRKTLSVEITQEIT